MNLKSRVDECSSTRLFVCLDYLNESRQWDDLARCCGQPDQAGIVDIDLPGGAAVLDLQFDFGDTACQKQELHYPPIEAPEMVEAEAPGGKR